VSIKNICENIKKYKSFLITTHVSPEGDALGSELGFYYLARKLDKRAIIVNADPVPYGLDFLPGKVVIHYPHQELRLSGIDCFVVLDCADLKRTGKVYKLNTGNKPVLNIDHHVSNRLFGDVQWVDPTASSCSEMIYKIYKQLRLPIGREAALGLYTGIMTDTGSFRYSNTSSFTHQAVAELMQSGLDVAQVYRHAYGNIPLEDIRSLLKILPNIKFSAQGKIVWFEITQEILGRRTPDIDLGDFVLSFGRAIKGVEVVALFKQMPGDKKEIRVNLRSQGKVDVNKIASFFGGGGHRTAAGCTLSGDRLKVSERVLHQIRLALK